MTSLKGIFSCLRQVEYDDAEFIVQLRNNANLNKYIHSSSLTIESQREWLKKNMLNGEDKYFIIISNASNKRVGTISLYNFDLDKDECEWGRWIVDDSAITSIESVYLLFNYAFERRRLKRLYCRTVAENLSTLSFHDRIGLDRTCRLEKVFNLNGVSMDAIQHSLAENKWPSVKRELEATLKTFSERVEVYK